MDLSSLPEGLQDRIERTLLGNDGRAWLPQLKPRTPTAKLINAMLVERESYMEETWAKYSPDSDNADPNWYQTREEFARDLDRQYRWWRWKWLKEISTLDRYLKIADKIDMPIFLGLFRI